MSVFHGFWNPTNSLLFNRNLQQLLNSLSLHILPIIFGTNSHTLSPATVPAQHSQKNPQWRLWCQHGAEPVYHLHSPNTFTTPHKPTQPGTVDQNQVLPPPPAVINSQFQHPVHETYQNHLCFSKLHDVYGKISITPKELGKWGLLVKLARHALFSQLQLEGDKQAEHDEKVVDQAWFDNLTSFKTTFKL